MAVSEVTIKMPRESLDKWLAALRSGEYQQSRGCMRGNTGYCCLGVLQECLTGTVEELPVPSREWLHANKITFLGSTVWDGKDPYLPSIDQTAASANDSREYSFSDIADAIEQCAEGT